MVKKSNHQRFCKDSIINGSSKISKIRPKSILIPVKAQKRCLLTSIGNPIVEIRQSSQWDFLVRWHLYIESGSWLSYPDLLPPHPAHWNGTIPTEAWPSTPTQGHTWHCIKINRKSHPALIESVLSHTKAIMEVLRPTSLTSQLLSHKSNLKKYCFALIPTVQPPPLPPPPPPPPPPFEFYPSKHRCTIKCMLKFAAKLMFRIQIKAKCIVLWIFSKMCPWTQRRAWL